MSALQQLHNMVGKNENILWSGKPNFKCFLLEAIFNPLLIFSLITILVCGFSIFMITFVTTIQGVVQASNPVGMAQGVSLMNSPEICICLLIALAPILMYLSGFLFVGIR